MAASKGLFLLLLCLGLLTTMAAATQFKVGGSMGWTVPGDSNSTYYNQWAESRRFKIGDTLLFVYKAGGDSVLQVSQEAYSTCNTSSPIHRYSDGYTVFALDRSGPFYFISGVEENCLRKESLHVVVLADRSGNPSPSPPKSGASLKVVGFMGTAGALLGSLLVI